MGKGNEDTHGDIAGAAFDRLDVREVEDREFGELLLSETSLDSDVPDIRSDALQSDANPIFRHLRRLQGGVARNNRR